VVASALVAALFGCVCCIMLVPAATELAASSSGLMQADEGIPGHAGCMSAHGSELAPGRHAALQVARVHRIRRIMLPLQLRSLGSGWRRRAASSTATGSRPGLGGARRRGRGGAAGRG